MTPLAGKRAIVTAGASGIGAVIAATLLHAGASVSVCDIDRDRMDAFGKIHPAIPVFLCDVADSAMVARTFEQMIGALGGIDILVNNAGIAGPTAGVEAISPADWDQTVIVNLSAQFYFCRLAVPYMKQQASGSIINMSSAAGRLGFPYRTPYAAAKWGVIGFTQSLAMELGPDNIRVNAVLPGSVTGARMTKVMAERAALLGVPEASVLADEIKNISMRTMIDPLEIADLIAFVCSDAGRSISGQSLGVCGNTETLR